MMVLINCLFILVMLRNCFMHDELDTSANVINFWDAEGSTPVYIRLHITDVQGCLK